MQLAARPGLVRDREDRPVLLVSDVVALVALHILELIEFVKLFVVKPFQLRRLLIITCDRVHVQSCHHLVTRLVIQECLVLDPVMKLETAVVRV
jgi:hypothetical protein